jgi:putative transposase
MARQPRFLLPGEAHLIQQAGHNGAVIAHDDDDRRQWLGLLRDAAATHRIRVHAWALDRDAFRLLLTPPAAPALSRLMQALGRRYVGWFNARHGRSGTLWDGRFQACLVEPGAPVLAAMRFVEAPATAVGGATAAALASSLAHHVGQSPDPLVSDADTYWALGNTPFERQAAYRALTESGLSAKERADMAACLRSGRPFGSDAYIGRLQPATARPLVPGQRGRPRRA